MRRITCRDSFSLIELLVVIVVMGILAGFIFKLMNSANKQADMARCLEKMERVAHAIEEFKSEYGQYPPVEPGACDAHSPDCRICYMYESPTNMPGSLRADYFKKNDGGKNLFRYGLVAYLKLRGSGFEHSSWTDKAGDSHVSSAYKEDEGRDIEAKKRWATFMDDPYSVVDSGYTARSEAGVAFSNALDSISGPWGLFHYKSDPPYTTYDLWAPGPDGKTIRKGGRME